MGHCSAHPSVFYSRTRLFKFYKINPLASVNCMVCKFSLCQPLCTIMHDCMLGSFKFKAPLPWRYLEFKPQHHLRIKGAHYSQPMHCKQLPDLLCITNFINSHYIEVRLSYCPELQITFLYNLMLHAQKYEHLLNTITATIF
jgi:hypothetical protein